MPSESKAELKERMRGLLLSLCLFAMFIVWAFDAPVLLRYGTSSVVTSIFAWWIVSAILDQAQLDRIRNQQAQQHQNAKQAE